MARARKYNRILTAAKYYSAIDNYLKYITDSTRKGVNVGKGEPRPKSKKLYIVPFALALKDGQVVQQSGALPAFTTYGGNFGNHIEATAPTDETDLVNPDNYRAARVIIVTGRSNNSKSVKRSKVTGMPYNSYGGKSTSLPFGKKNSTETEQAAFIEIENALTGGAEDSGLLISWQKEKV